MRELFYYCFYKVIRFLLDFTTTVFFRFISGKSKKLPPITNPILLQSATQLAVKIRKKQLKSVDVVSAYISRIKDVQPIINAVVDERFNSALEEARAADDFIASGIKSEAEIEKEKPLLGVPFSCKEAISVKGMSFTAGVVSRKGTKAKSDSAAVTSLREAGAIPIASTNVCQHCLWYDSANNLYGITRNPYDTRRIPGGSTGGEGALIAAAGSVFGVGNDLGGSVRCPAFMNGIFGHKVSRGVGSNKGQFPDFDEMFLGYGVTGPLCRYASDLILATKILSNQDKRLRWDTQVNFKNLKIYYMDDDGGNPFNTPVVPEIKNALKKVLTYFEETYDVHPQKLHLKALKESFEIWAGKVLLGEGPPLIDVLGEPRGPINLHWELLKCCFRLSENTLPSLVLAYTQTHYQKKGVKEREEFSKQLRELEDDFQNILKENCVFLYPTHPEPAPYQHQTFHKICNVGYTGIFNILGFPATHCPLGLCRGLPIGIQVIGGIYNDHLTISVANELQKVFGGWISPCPITLQK